jgi:hypothetical protein
MTIDKFIVRHLSDWCDTQFPLQSNQVFDRMIGHLRLLDEPDYLLALERGWWRLFDDLPEPQTCV